MSRVLFLSVPAHGNVNPTLGLVSELVKRGEEIVYFCSGEFQDNIEHAGAIFKCYNEDLDIFKAEVETNDSRGSIDPMMQVILSGERIIADILQQVDGLKFDYIIHSFAFPYAKAIRQILKLPAVSSLAIFAGLQGFIEGEEEIVFPDMEEMKQAYKQTANDVMEEYGVQMPDDMMHLLFNQGDLNFVYTSEYFIADTDKEFLLKIFGDSCKFVGPPVYERKEDLDFPFDILKDEKVIYISLGTVFSNYNINIYQTFFDAFCDIDAIVVMAAYNVDLSQLSIPNNFIVRNYVPQSAILKHTTVAITHAGMNSISDLAHHNVPFVCLPLGADQPELAARAVELGATISLDINTLQAEELRASIEEVMADGSYLQNIQQISKSFREAGGYARAVNEVFALKQAKGIH